MATRTLSSAWGSTLGTVAVTADTIAKTVDSFATGIDIVHAKLDYWREQAILDSAVDKLDARDRSIIRGSHRKAELDQETEIRCADPQYRTFFDTARTEIEQKLTELKL